MLEFNQLPSPFSEITVYGAAIYPYTFVISKQEGKFTASAKIAGDNTRYGLGSFGEYNTFEQAELACERFLKEKN